MSTRRSGKPTAKMTGGADNSDTPLRRSARPSKRKLTKAENSESENPKVSPNAKKQSTTPKSKKIKEEEIGLLKQLKPSAKLSKAKQRSAAIQTSSNEDTVSVGLVPSTEEVALKTAEGESPKSLTQTDLRTSTHNDEASNMEEYKRNDDGDISNGENIKVQPVTRKSSRHSTPQETKESSVEIVKAQPSTSGKQDISKKLDIDDGKSSNAHQEGLINENIEKSLSEKKKKTCIVEVRYPPKQSEIQAPSDKAVIVESINHEKQIFQKEINESLVQTGNRTSEISVQQVQNIEECDQTANTENCLLVPETQILPTPPTPSNVFEEKGTKEIIESSVMETSSTQSEAHLRRKRVASELLHAAEIAHGLLDTPTPPDSTTITPTVTQSPVPQQKNMVSIMSSQASQTVLHPMSNSSQHTATSTNPSAPTTQPYAARRRMANEKLTDSVFEGVTAIIKTSIVDTEETKNYLLNDLPKITGVSTVISPTGHYLLHGSWLSIIRSRMSLDKYFGKKTTSGNKEESEITQPEVSTDLPTEEETFEDVEDEIQTAEDNMDLTENIMEEIDLGPSARIKGLDRSQLQGSVEVYKDATNATTYLCNKCGFSHKEKKSVVAHINKLHAVPSVKCHFCGDLFQSRAHLNIHITERHFNDEKFICNLCNKHFTSKRYLATHMKRHMGIKNHQCGVCGRRFFEGHKLKWHLETHKSEEDKKLPYACSICGKKFYNRSSLSDHQNIHTGARPFECDRCDASFSHRIGLKRHLTVHSDERPYPCSTCGKAFKMYKLLEKHEIIHTGQSQHRCEQCKKVFTTQFSLKRHALRCEAIRTLQLVTEEPASQISMETVTQEDLQNEQTVFMCGICDQLFQSLEEAADHARSHNNSEDADENGAENYVQDPDDQNLTIVETEEEVEGETASKILRAMSSQEEYVVQELPVSMDDTHLVANTLADLSALGQVN